MVQDVEVFHVEQPPVKHKFNSYASPTPIVEAGRVYVCFGTNGSACLDSSTGQPIWVNRDLKIDHINGPGSSPLLFDPASGGDFHVDTVKGAAGPKVGRNDPCPCGSGKKYKKCCGA